LRQVGHAGRRWSSSGRYGPRWRNHTFRGTGITAHLETGGTLEKARQMAAHASTRTTQLYDRREDRVTLDEVVKINIRG
jgi:integrase